MCFKFFYTFVFLILFFSSFFFDWRISPTTRNVQSPLHNLGRPTVPSHAFDHVTHFVQFAKYAKHPQPTFCKVQSFTLTNKYFEIF